ncbi:nuclear transport factor 2 family protein [Lysobacter sp. TY2-98]|uniref:nuclear transport factor 2 family protein n=1 Tax=Lysobacter sp. TY2-98 TaxID=2290922 RepID=UPI000E204D4B|nr:nuclear transport factor 2 family protein [Lysobacter sp. TY2-98]AXK72180.1 nuclear transport factor 2 family protein [Lysobacter sp. TY2-98]
MRQLALAVALSSAALHAHAADCSGSRTPDQHKDVDTLQRIERGWLAAEAHGDTGFLDCLLDPAYSVIVARDNAVRSKADLLARVATNRGKTGDVPPLDTTVVISGDYATAYSVMHGTGKGGQPYDARYVDSYRFENGAWHTFAGVDL